jgi:hypothetical protein
MLMKTKIAINKFIDKWTAFSLNYTSFLLTQYYGRSRYQPGTADAPGSFTPVQAENFRRWRRGMIYGWPAYDRVKLPPGGVSRLVP